MVDILWCGRVLAKMKMHMEFLARDITLMDKRMVQKFKSILILYVTKQIHLQQLFLAEDMLWFGRVTNKMKMDMEYLDKSTTLMGQKMDMSFRLIITLLVHKNTHQYQLYLMVDLQWYGRAMAKMEMKMEFIVKNLNPTGPRVKMKSLLIHTP